MKKIIAAIALTIATSTLQAAVVFNNGSGTQSTQANYATYRLMADDFSLDNPALITGASGYFGNMSLWDGAIEYHIFSDNNNMPGNILAQGFGINSTVSPSQPANPWVSISILNFDFQQEFYALPNTKYWFSIHPAKDYSQTNYATVWWMYVLNSGNSAFTNFGDLNSWTHDYSGELAFSLRGQVVPVPAAAWLMGSSLLGLAGIARRRKASSLLIK